MKILCKFALLAVLGHADVVCLGTVCPSQFLHRDDAQINFLEMLAVVLLVEILEDLLSSNAVFCFIDNKGVLGSLIKGCCRAPETGILCSRAAQPAWVPFWACVEFKANIADGPSRGDFTEVLKFSAVWVDPMLPAWLSHLWFVN